MAKNDFLPFATANGANVLSVDEYQKLASRSNGFSAGVARSQELNTVWRQASVMSSALGQFIADRTQKDVLDDGDAKALQAGFEAAVKAWNQTNTPAASTTVAGITRLSSATDSNDETMAATPRAVKAAYDLARKVSVDSLYPIGIVVWFAQNKDPNELFPGTTWKYIGENKTVRLAAADGKDVMTTGGADSIKLSVDNLPAHSHAFSGNTSSSGNHAHTRGTMNIVGSVGNGKDDIFGIFGQWDTNGAFSVSGKSGKKWPVAQTGNDRNTAVIFDASRSWTGETSYTGDHIHAISGRTSVAGANSSISIENAFVKLMAWYRVA